MLVGWLVFPLLLGLLAVGCGVALEYVSGRPLRGALLAPAGLAVLIVVAHPATLSDPAAELAVPAVLAVAAAGLVLASGRARPRLDPWAAGCALAVFAAYAAPALLSGEVVAAGYVKLDDTASWLALAERLGDQGTSYAGLPPSTYEAMLDFYLGGNYPMGGLLPLTVGTELFATDGLELYQPFIAFLAALLALSLYVIAEGMIATPWLRAVAVFVASQAALLYAYGLWGGSKEVATAWLIALVAALFEPAVRDRLRGRALLPLAVAGAAILAVLSLGGGVWLVGFLVPALIVAFRGEGAQAALRRLAVLAGLLVLLAIPSLTTAGFLGSSAVPLSETSDQTGLANLIKPISPLQALGIWPVGDFRVDPEEMAPTYLLLLVAAAAAVLGLLAAWRARAWTLLAYVGASFAGAVIVLAVGTAWIDAKALAALSPALVLAALAGAAAIAARGRVVEAVAVALVVAGGVAWSNALGYNEAQLTPHDRFEELQRIGAAIEGEGPTLMTDYEPWGARLFLRDAAPEGASELRRRQVYLRDGDTLGSGEAADIGAFRLDAVLEYRTLVLRRSPFATRPPSVYALASSGRYYDVWQREPGEIVEHVAVGGRRARCADVLRVARRGRQVAYAPSRPAPLRLDLAAPSFTIRSAGTFEVGVIGAFRDRLELRIDGRTVATRRHELAHGTPYVFLAELPLEAGSHRLEVERSASVLRPGSGGSEFSLTGVVVAPVRDIAAFESLPAGEARSLCGRRLDWIEALP